MRLITPAPALTPSNPYRGRIAPSPTGLLHVGHARTFWTAQQRARDAGGILILRNEDIDRSRCKPEFVEAMLEDLRWFGIDWQEGCGVGGPHEPYDQSRRNHLYRNALEHLKATGNAYPCTCSRKDIQMAATAPHGADDEAIYPGTCRHRNAEDKVIEGTPVSWRFRLLDGESIAFEDGFSGTRQFVAGRDFGDFVLWRNDDVPSYQLAVTVDDAAMEITEVVRGEDLLVSTARQLLLYRALNLPPPDFYHCPLVTDAHGVRLAKRTDSLSLRGLRSQGVAAGEIRRGWF